VRGTIAITIVVLADLTACGYQVLRGDRPFGASRVALVPFAEDVPVGLSPELASALAQQLAAEGMSIILDEQAADAVLSGRVVTSRTVQSPSSGVGARVPAYDIRVKIVAWLNDKAGKELWRTEVELGEAFLPSIRPSGEVDVNGTLKPNDNVLLETEANRRRALLRLADVAARTITERLAIAGTEPAPGGT